MESRFVRLVVVFLLIFLVFSGFHLNLPVVESTGTLPSRSCFFTENKGQWDSSILFVGDTNFGKVAFTKDAVYYQMAKSGEETFETQLVKLSFVNPQLPSVQGDGLLSHYNNYFIGSDSTKWASYCRNFEKIKYRDVWTGIDLAYFFTPEGLKYEYYVDPQANIQDLQIKVEGAELTSMGGSLQIATALGNIQDANLKVFDQTTLRTIPSSFKIQNGIVSFTGIPEKREHTIVIDPLVWSTYLGGSEDDYISGFSLDKDGNVIVCGTTMSFDFPTNPKVERPRSYSSIFIAKLNSTGSSLLFSSYIGGSVIDRSVGITIDEEGNCYISGSTFSKDFPTTKGVFQEKFNGIMDTFITKLNSSGTSILYSTFLGGKDVDEPIGIMVDKEKNVCIAGETMSKDFPVTPDAYQSKLKGTYKSEIFVSKLNANGSLLLFSTYIGGSDYDRPYGFAADNKGNVYILGETGSDDFPTTEGVIQPKKGGIFLLKTNTASSRLIYSTYLGGDGYGFATALTLDSQGNAYIGGSTSSRDFYTTDGVCQPNYWGGDCDGFLMKINSNATAVIFSTFIGGSRCDKVNGIDIDEKGNIYLSGMTSSYDFPKTDGAFQTKTKGDWDGFLMKLNHIAAEIVYSTYIGGSGDDRCGDIYLDSTNKAYICGSSGSKNYPTTKGCFQEKRNNEVDAFMTKFDFDAKEQPPDKTGPVIELTSPEDYKVTTEDKIQIAGKVYDLESDIDSLTINGIKVNIDQSNGSFIHDKSLKMGKNILNIIGSNVNELKTKIILTITRINQDTSPPILEIISPEDNSITPYNQIEVKGRVVDQESGIKSITINDKIVEFEKDNGSFADTFYLSSGENKIEIVATNFIGLTTSKILNIKRIDVDKTPPVITIYEPLPNSEITDPRLIVKGKVIDQESGLMEVSVNNKKVSFNDKGEFETTVILEEYKNLIRVEAIDKMRNKSFLSIEVIYSGVFKDTFIIELWVDKPQAFIDGKPYVIDVPPMVRRGRTQVPIRFIAEGLRATVNYDAKTQKIVIQYKTTTITLQIDNPEASIENIEGEIKTTEKTILEMPPYIYKGRTMVPIRLISEALGAKVEYGSTDRSIVISMKR